MKKILIILALLFASQSYSQRNRKVKVKVVYKKRQKIDLGALVIDGELMSPGDFNVDDEKENASKFLFKRKNHNDRLRINIEYVF